jgi:excinuclease ABC subunit A
LNTDCAKWLFAQLKLLATNPLYDPRVPKCPTHKIDLVSQTVSQMVDSILTLPESEKIMILAPVVQNRKGSHTKMLDELSNNRIIK